MHFHAVTLSRPTGAVLPTTTSFQLDRPLVPCCCSGCLSELYLAALTKRFSDRDLSSSRSSRQESHPHWSTAPLRMTPDIPRRLLHICDHCLIDN